MAFRERELNAYVVIEAKIFGHIREGGLCGDWPIKADHCIVIKGKITIVSFKLDIMEKQMTSFSG